MSVVDPFAPLSGEEISELFTPWLHEKGIGLAVSGGCDSVALMLTVASWHSRMNLSSTVVVLTVDHGLRPGSDSVALQVSEWAGGLGLPCQYLSWCGRKPISNIQEIARENRYRLLLEACRKHKLGCLFTGHHLQDQAETFLLRLSRGSGVDGLSGMETERRVSGLRLCRPFLNVPVGRLRATVKASGHPFLDDPGNHDFGFARVRFRSLFPAMSSEGLTARRLADTARRMRRVRTALSSMVVHLSARAARFDPAGFCILDRSILCEAPEELILRLLVKALMLVGGQSVRPRARSSEALAYVIATGGSGRRTLHGCCIDIGRDNILIWREFGRHGLPEINVKPGDDVLWDGRFHVRLSAVAPGPVKIKALGVCGWSEMVQIKEKHRFSSVIGRTCPSVWRGDVFLAAPPLILPESEGCPDVVFVGLESELLLTDQKYD
ncbi:MAG: tRNA lysidine(34) synthetase TilS [Alphaproteobacteria bacterium]|nr:tRNA lysidine(34) synthetase TilS [Alphaproteobacteria bacterium]